MFIGEVIETKKAFKPKQKDDEGNVLPLGSIQIRIGSEDHLGQVKNIWARPAEFSSRRIPLIGEHVIVFTAPTHDNSNEAVKAVGYFYFPPINATDDLTFHHYPKLWKRSKNTSGGSAPGSRLADQKIPGYTFPKKPKSSKNLQIFEGDVLYEGRFGQSIRFGSTVVGNTSVYQEKPWWKGGSNTDPLMIMRVKKPGGLGSGLSNISNSNYTIEDIDGDESSIYMTSTQKLIKLKSAFSSNRDSLRLGTWSSGAQIVLNSDRIVLNAKKDMAFVLSKNKTIIAGKKVLLQSQKHNVDLDDLMEFIKKFLQMVTDLTKGVKQFSTAAGPTLVSTNMAQFIKHNSVTFNTKFKKP